MEHLRGYELSFLPTTGVDWAGTLVFQRVDPAVPESASLTDEAGGSARVQIPGKFTLPKHPAVRRYHLHADLPDGRVAYSLEVHVPGAAPTPARPLPPNRVTAEPQNGLALRTTALTAALPKKSSKKGIERAEKPNKPTASTESKLSPQDATASVPEPAPAVNPPKAMLTVHVVSTKDRQSIPNVDLGFRLASERPGTFQSNYEFKISDQPIALDPGEWLIRPIYSKQSYRVKLKDKDNKTETIAINPLGELEIQKQATKNVTPDEIIINGQPWDGKKIMVPSGELTIHLDNPYYKKYTEYSMVINEGKTSIFAIPHPTYGILDIIIGAGMKYTPNPSLIAIEQPLGRKIFWESAITSEWPLEGENTSEQRVERLKILELPSWRKKLAASLSAFATESLLDGIRLSDMGILCLTRIDHFFALPGEYKIQTNQGIKAVTITAGRSQILEILDKTKGIEEEVDKCQRLHRIFPDKTDIDKLQKGDFIPPPLSKPSDGTSAPAPA
jgi:hypothetical protein